MKTLDPVTHEDPSYARGWNDAMEFIRKVPGTHPRGDAHRYHIVCTVCGEPGVLRVTIDPEEVGEDDDPWDLDPDLPADLRKPYQPPSHPYVACPAGGCKLPANHQAEQVTRSG